ncbi:MAG: RNA polymerase sigma-54 factor [Opitutales bacterium]|jgi:RNA polymerase sigma-54 factor|nr:MAG: RNA polymerase sigma-54 factor [Opitutales bacterium]
MSSQSMAHQGINQSQKQVQGLVLTPQLRQSLRILQVPAAELLREISEEMAANPLLEEVEPIANESSDAPARAEEPEEDGPRELSLGDDDFDALRRMKEDWDESYYEEVRSQGYTQEDEDRRRHMMESATAESSIAEHLAEQARTASDDAAVQEALKLLISSLDERGFLEEDLSTIALRSGQSYEAVTMAHTLLLGFDPSGIGARDLRECFSAQLRQRGRGLSTAARLIADCWEPMMGRRLDECARILDVEIDGIREALAELAKLETVPARRFMRDDNRVVTPDATVELEEDGKWKVIMDDRHVPKLRLVPAYKDMLAGQALSEKERTYILERMRQGKFLIGAIEERQRTIERLARIITERQAEYFAYGPSKLKPLTMTDVAKEMEVHETTVGRAAANKWMLTPHGLKEFRWFFTSGVATDDGGTVAQEGVQEMIADILARENPAAPLADEAITVELRKRGVQIARRTVAKYREALGQPSAHMRRQRL